jgi:large subunit ribosomal protein L21
MYALIDFKGKQYKAEVGKTLKVDKLDAAEGASIDIDTVLLLGGDTVTVGTPYVPGAKVTARVQQASGKDKKIIVFKYIPKKDYRVKQGHRQQFSVIKIENISA